MIPALFFFLGLLIGGSLVALYFVGHNLNPWSEP